METRIVKVDRDNPDPAKIQEAAVLVDAGGLVAFPTETVYGIACRVDPESLRKLDEVKERGPQKYYTLHIADETEVNRYVPTIGIRTVKLIKQAWPGPVTIIFDLEAKDIDKLRSSFEQKVFRCLYKNDSIGIRCPDDGAASMLLRCTDRPVVAPSANVTGQPPPGDGEAVLAQLSGRIDLLLDAGRCKYKQNSTVVRIWQKGLQVVRAGVYSQRQLETMSRVRFLFVCTGNTCRSPMAEGMFRECLAEKLKCDIDQLEQIGYIVSSAGVIGMAGFGASAEAVTACAAKGVDIRGHVSQVLSEELIKESDFVFAMCRAHCERIIALSPEAVDKCVLLAEDTDIPDPIGQSQEVYNRCADLIEKAVKERIGELKL